MPKLLLSGYSALAEYTMLNAPSVECFAADSIAEWEKSSSVRLQNSNDQNAIEFWKYDPKKLTGGECVDKLSLALALQEDKDERTEDTLRGTISEVSYGNKE